MSCYNPPSCLSKLWTSPTKNRIDPVTPVQDTSDGAQVLLAWYNRSVNLDRSVNINMISAQCYLLICELFMFSMCLFMSVYCVLRDYDMAIF